MADGQPFCANTASWLHAGFMLVGAGSAPVQPVLQEAEKPLRDTGPWFPTEKSCLSLANFGTDARDCGYTKAESSVSF